MQLFFYGCCIIAGIVTIEKGHDSTENIVTLVGINSWNAACGYVEYLSVFSRVTYAIEWIRGITGNQNE